MLISLNKLNLFAGSRSFPLINRVGNVLIDPFDGCPAWAAWNRLLPNHQLMLAWKIPWRGHYYVGHLCCHVRCTATHNIFQDTSNISERLRLGMTCNTGCWWPVGLRVIVSLSWWKYQRLVGTTVSSLHIDLRLNLLLARVISLCLRSIVIVTLYNVAEIQAVLDGRCANLLLSPWIGSICTKILQLLSLLYFFHALASEVLKISEAAIVLDIVDYCCEILLLLIGWADSLVHDI